MKKIILPVLLLNSLYISSQELDEAYLNSLPDDIRKDVLEQVDDRDELDKTVYRRPSTMIRKNYCSDLKKDRNERIESDYYKNITQMLVRYVLKNLKDLVVIFLT